MTSQTKYNRDRGSEYVSSEVDVSVGVLATALIASIFTLYYLPAEPINAHPNLMVLLFFLAYDFLINRILDLFNYITLSRLDISDSDLFVELHKRRYISDEELETAMEVADETDSVSQSIELHIEEKP